MDLSPESVRAILIGVLVLLVSVAFHEFGHAFVAHKLGDDTPSRQGRVTLNPLAHADPIGTLLLPLLGGVVGGGGFGWGKPVQWQPHKIRRGVSMTTANILVSFAGPFMNLVLATVFVLAHVILISQGVLDGHVEGKVFASDPDGILLFVVGTNFVLFFFNLLPLPPLDGGHIAEAFTPRRHRTTFENIAKYSPFIILGVMLIPQVRQVFLVPAMWCTETLYAGIRAIFL
jgi:Zn-dependent protease